MAEPIPNPPPSSASRPIPDIRIDGTRPNLWLLLPNAIVFGLLVVELHEGSRWAIYALMVLIAAFSAVLIARFVRPPRLMIHGGWLSYRYGFRGFRVPAADLAEAHMQNRYVVLTFTDAERVEPPSMRERMRSSFRQRRFHCFLPAAIFSLEQVNQLRTALDLRPQWNDPGGDAIDEFHGSIRAQRPLVTQALIAACVIVFFVKSYFEQSLLGGSVKSNIAWGANFGPLTLGGQWWRLVTYMFLHGGLVHLGMNMYVFWDVGRLMERLIGRTALVLIYFVSGMAGGILSAAMHPDAPSIGASGAVFGMFGALFGLLLHARQAVPPSRLKELRFAIVIFLVLNLMFGMSIRGVDMMAHGGGAAAGFIAGLIVVPSGWRNYWRRAALLAIVGAAGIALALHAIPTPFDFVAFIQRHDLIVEKFKELETESQQGKLSDSDLADRLDAEVLGPWREMESQLPDTRFGSFTSKQRADFRRYLQLRQASFQDLIAALRTGNVELAKRSADEAAEAGKIEHELDADPDGDR